jgi:hypothetical protein
VSLAATLLGVRRVVVPRMIPSSDLTSGICMLMPSQDQIRGQREPDVRVIADETNYGETWR